MSSAVREGKLMPAQRRTLGTALHPGLPALPTGTGIVESRQRMAANLELR